MKVALLQPTKRVSLIQSILADPEKKKKLMVDSIIATQAREGIKTTREQAEAAYEKTQIKEPVRGSTTDRVRRPVRNEADDSVVDVLPARRSAKIETPSAEAKEIIERVQAVTGVLRAYDGRYCVWGTNGLFDMRDIGTRIGLSMQDILEALPTFAPAKRGRASVTTDATDATDDSTE